MAGIGNVMRDGTEIGYRARVTFMTDAAVRYGTSRKADLARRATKQPAAIVRYATALLCYSLGEMMSNHAPWGVGGGRTEGNSSRRVEDRRYSVKLNSSRILRLAKRVIYFIENKIAMECKRCMSLIRVTGTSADEMRLEYQNR